MSKGILIALSNPVSPDRDAEFNDWYDKVHGREVTSLKGFAGLTRYKAQVQALPPAATPQYQYLALYELDDIDQALRSLAEGAAKFAASDAVDLHNALGIAFTQIFSTRD